MAINRRSAGPMTSASQPIPFPRQEALRRAAAFRPRAGDHALRSEDALSHLELASRRMDDLARALNCLGFFDDESGPRAA